MIGNTDIYNLNTGKFLPQLHAVDNIFIRQLANLAIENAKQLKIVSFIQRDITSNRGEVAKRGIHPSEKSVIDMCKLTPLAGLSNARSLLEEIAVYRWGMLGFQAEYPDKWRDLQYFLMTDYLLASSLCYVEVFDDSAKVDKFFATRNRFLAGQLVGLQPNQTTKYSNYLTPYYADYEGKQLRVLKLTKNSKGYRVTQPRSAIDFANKSVRVTPLFLMQAFLEGITPIMTSNILKFNYVKDNFIERELISTLSPEIIARYYDAGYAERIMASVEAKLTRGYIRIPELGISKYDDTGVRALNLTRITKIEILNDIDTRFIDVDFNLIIPCFKKTVDAITDLGVLSFLTEALTNDVLKTDNYLQAQQTLKSFVDGQYAIGTTTFLRQLHLLMIQFPQIFHTYNGGKPVSFGGYDSSYNLGVE